MPDTTTPLLDRAARFAAMATAERESLVMELTDELRRVTAERDTAERQRTELLAYAAFLQSESTCQKNDKDYILWTPEGAVGLVWSIANGAHHRLAFTSVDRVSHDDCKVAAKEFMARREAAGMDENQEDTPSRGPLNTVSHFMEG